MTQLESHKDEIAQSGLKVVAIALGEPKHAQRYCPALAPSIHCYCNQTMELYFAYGLRRAEAKSIFKPGLWMSATRAVLKGHVQGEATGDIAMLPGTFVVDQQGIIQYAHYNAHAGDHPHIPDLLRVRV